MTRQVLSHYLSYSKKMSGAPILTTISPKEDIVRVGIASALKEVEEEMAGTDVYIACICTVNVTS